MGSGPTLEKKAASAMTDSHFSFFVEAFVPGLSDAPAGSYRGRGGCAFLLALACALLGLILERLTAPA